jgi:rhodanese-related sulfurtransferase
MLIAAKRQFKDALFDEFARIGKALSSGRRLEILELLAQRERTVEDLATETAMSVANCSQHLQVLRRARIVEVQKRGLYVGYRLSDDGVLRLWLSLCDVGHARLAEIGRLVQTYCKNREDLEAISSEQLRQRLKSEAIVVLDVRPEEEYRAGHIADARSIPVAELDRRLAELPKRKAIVAYCRGPYCVFADEAVDLLRARGYKAMRLDIGFPQWKAQGLPIAVSPPTA